MKTLIAVVEVHDFTGIPANHMSLEPPWQEDAVRIKLDSPLEFEESAQVDDLMPGSDKNPRVQRCIVLASKATLQRAGHDYRLD